mgnify:CR=1 FL=1
MLEILTGNVEIINLNSDTIEYAIIKGLKERCAQKTNDDSNGNRYDKQPLERQGKPTAHGKLIR